MQKSWSLGKQKWKHVLKPRAGIKRAQKHDTPPTKLILACRKAGARRLNKPRVGCRNRRSKLCFLRRSYRRHDGTRLQKSAYPQGYKEWIKAADLSGGAATYQAKKRKNRTRRQSPQADGAAISALVQALRSSLLPGASLQQVLTTLQDAIRNPPPKQQVPKKRKNRKARRTQTHEGRPRDAGLTPPSDPPPPGKTLLWRFADGSTRPYQVEQSGWWSWVSHAPQKKAGSTQVTHSETVPCETIVSPVSHHAKLEGEAKNLQKPNPVARLRTMDWDAGTPPKIVSFGKIKACLREGHPIPGNVTELWTEDQIQELRTLWAAFDRSEGLTALLCGNARRSEGAHWTRLMLTRGSSRENMEQVALLEIGKKGPWIPKPKVVPADKFPSVEQLTVRVTAPAAFRRFFLETPEKPDMPAEVIKALATLTSGKVTDFCGGRWSSARRHGQEQLIAFLKLKPKLAQELINASGQRGIFASLVGKSDESNSAESQPPLWIDRESNEGDDSYLRRVISIGASRKQPLIHRLGKGSTLGFVCRTKDEQRARERLLAAKGVPRSWSTEDLTAFLGNMGWPPLQAMNKKYRTWYFRAIPPDLTCTSWRYETAPTTEADTSRPAKCIEVLAVNHNARNPVKTVALQAPRRIKWKEDPPAGTLPKKDSPSLPSCERKGKNESGAQPTQLDEPSQKSRRTDASRSPRRDKSGGPPDQHEEDVSSADTKESTAKRAKRQVFDPVEAQANGWRVWDQHGSGDCFFRALSVFDLTDISEQPTLEASRKAGAWLRSQAVGHIRKTISVSRNFSRILKTSMHGSTRPPRALHGLKAS